MRDPVGNAAAIDFVLALRRGWASGVYPALRREFDLRRDGEPNGDPLAIAPLVRQLPSYAWFAWLERGSQRMLWRAVTDAVAAAGEPAFEPVSPATLQLDPQLELPQWYTAYDIHLQPGGVWSRASAAAVYELGAKLVMLGENDDYKFHRLFTETAVPRRRYRRIVDLGCGFGKSTWPLKKAFADAETIGIDLAEPCLRLAAHRAGRQGLAIHFRQADACSTGVEAGSADLVTSTMLVHELPLDVTRRVLAEAARLLAPGGVLRFLDFRRTGDAFRDLAMLEHGTRNNEPYLPAMLLADVATMAAQAGFANVRWVAFDERSRGRLADLTWPAREEWHFPWAVLEAEKPS